jgi:hypothetical protein
MNVYNALPNGLLKSQIHQNVAWITTLFLSKRKKTKKITKPHAPNAKKVIYKNQGFGIIVKIVNMIFVTIVSNSHQLEL